MAKIEEMERLLREAQAEKLRLLEHRVKDPNQNLPSMYEHACNLIFQRGCAGAGDGVA